MLFFIYKENKTREVVDNQPIGTLKSKNLPKRTYQ